jgi:intein/homing endonuclease
MATYQHFQSENNKISKNRYDTRNPALNPAVSARGLDEVDNFTKNLHKYIDFVSWARWFPDLWWDLITPETGGIRLDLDQRVYLRAVARFVSNYMVFPRGYGKCVSGDTLIITEDGFKEIGDYFNYSTINKEIILPHKINIVNRYGQLELTNAGVYSGYLPTKKIITEEGFEIEATHNHPLLIIDNDGQVKWRNISEIKIGDYVIINRNTGIWGNKTKLNIDMTSFLSNLGNCSKWKVKNAKSEIITELDEEFALILGYLVGDGCLTRDNVIMFTTKDQDILQNFTNFFKNRLKKEVKQKADIDYIVSGKFVREYFRQVGLKQANAFEKEIPKCILEAPKSIVAAFIRGLFDTDGGLSNSYIEFCTASEKLSKQLQVVLLNFGIVSTRKRKFNKKYNSYSYRIMIYGKNMDLYLKEIGFSCQRKQNQLISLCDKKRNPNKDIIPFQKELVTKYFHKAKKSNSYLYDKLYHVLKGNNELTYEKLKMLINLEGTEHTEEYSKLKSLNDLGYFYSKVSQVFDSHNHVYDLSVPQTHSFVSNGFVSHNTLLEVMGMVHTAIFFPDIEITMTAQTRENAAKLVDEKFREILKFYPLIQNELQGRPSFSKDSVEIVFTSGGRIDVMANAQSSKGARRKRLNVEESALLNNALFEDVLEPIVNVPRRTIGKQALINPEELNGQINFMTTSWFRGSDEFERNLRMVDEMAELKGKIVLGSDWQLACEYGRGETKAQILEKKEKLSPTFFAMNYGSKWVGASDGALVDINKIMELRTLSTPEFKGDGKSTYIISVDVARSQSKNNNQSSIAVLKIKRSKNDKITKIALVNLINLPNGLNFTGQAIEVKRVRNLYNAKTVVIDANGLGVGLLDELLKDTIDPLTGESLGCWATINTDHEPEIPRSEKVIYALTSQGINHDIIVNFIDMVESGKLQLLEKKQNSNYDIDDKDAVKQIYPFIQTDLLLEEIANLKLKEGQNKKYTVEQLTKRVDKDRYSSLAMGLWYIKAFEDKVKEAVSVNPLDYILVRKPKIYGK